MKFGAAIPCANDTTYLPAVVGQMLKVCARVVVLRGRTSFSGAPLDLRPLPALDPRVEIVEGDWADEAATRNAGMEILRDCDFVFCVDTDEIFSASALRFLCEVCVQKQPRALSCRLITYWKTCDYKIDPPENLIPSVVVRQDVRFHHLRMLAPGEVVLLVDRPLMHHLSYVRTDEEMRDKLRLFGHASEVVPGWYERVWCGWDLDHEMQDLHPTHPEVFKKAVFMPSAELWSVLSQYGLS